MRFTDGYYSRGADYAIMLGYVVVPPLDVALTRVRQMMNRKAGRTHQIAGMDPDQSGSARPGYLQKYAQSKRSWSKNKPNPFVL